MKKKMIVGIALAMGMLSVGAVSASAAGSCCTTGKCTDKQIAQKFSQDTETLAIAIKAKDIELRDLYRYDGIDVRKADELETKIKELKGKINVIAEEYGIPKCCIS